MTPYPRALKVILVLAAIAVLVWALTTDPPDYQSCTTPLVGPTVCKERGQP